MRELEIEYEVLHEDLESANKAERLEIKVQMLAAQNKYQADQIAKLNRELARSR